MATGSAPASPTSDGAVPGEGTAAATEGAAVAAAGGVVAAEADGVVEAGGAGGGSCAGTTAGATAGDTAGSGSGSGTGAGSPRGGSNPSGSTYPSSSAALRMPRWTLGTDCSGVPLVPIVPTGAPSETVSPLATPTAPRWTSVTEYPSGVRIETPRP